MAKITIDGRAFSCNCVRITERGEVLIDDMRQEDSVQGRVEVHVVEGVLQNLEVVGGWGAQPAAAPQFELGRRPDRWS